MIADSDRSVLYYSGNYNCGGFGGPWGVSSHMMEAQVYDKGAYLCTDLWKHESLLTSLRSCRLHHPSDNVICETLVCLFLHHTSSSFILNAIW